MKQAAAVLLFAAATAAQGPVAGHDGGFFLQSDDERYRLDIGGLFQTQFRAFQPDRGRDTEFVLERIRLEIAGKIDGLYRFNIEPNFNADEVELEEAWIGAELADGTLVMLGRMKEPFGFEEMLSRKHQDWVNFSILNQFSPAEDHGITVFGATAGGGLEYNVAAYNGSGGDETNSDKDVAGRLVWHPFAHRDDAWRALQFGIAGTVGRADSVLADATLRNEAKQDFLTFAPGTRMDGLRWRAGLEAGWYHGPAAVIAELLLLEQEMTAPGGTDDVRIAGGYCGCSWVLTGEDKTWKGIKPSRPVRGRDDDGLGALQFAARVSRLSLDPRLLAIGAVGASGFTDTVTTIDAGLNWYATHQARVRLHLVWTDYDEPIAFGGAVFGEELALLLQAQLDF